MVRTINSDGFKLEANFFKIGSTSVSLTDQDRFLLINPALPFVYIPDSDFLKVI